MDQNLPRRGTVANLKAYPKTKEVLMPMSEMTGLQRRVETLEDDLRAALSRLDRLEAKLADEDAKVCRLERAEGSPT